MKCYSLAFWRHVDEHPIISSGKPNIEECEDAEFELRINPNNPYYEIMEALHNKHFKESETGVLEHRYFNPANPFYLCKKCKEYFISKWPKRCFGNQSTEGWLEVKEFKETGTELEESDLHRKQVCRGSTPRCPTEESDDHN